MTAMEHVAPLHAAVGTWLLRQERAAVPGARAERARGSTVTARARRPVTVGHAAVPRLLTERREELQRWVE